MDKSNCHCENEAKVLYDMYKKMGTLRNGRWSTITCCEEGIAVLEIRGKNVTLTYASGTVQTYTGI